MALRDRGGQLGLIVTELVINAVKHAFADNPAAGPIAVIYDLSGAAWCLAVSDNGIGRRAQAASPGLGTGIIGALASQLDSCLEVATGPNGTTVSISHRRDLEPAPTAIPAASAEHDKNKNHDENCGDIHEFLQWVLRRVRSSIRAMHLVR